VDVEPYYWSPQENGCGNARVSPLPEEMIVTRSILPGEPLTTALVMDDNMIIIVAAPSPAEKSLSFLWRH
jgi:hypothetical protein